MNIPIIEVTNLKKIYPLHKNVFLRQKKYIHAVNNVSFKIFPQETVALAGESGCGKTAIERMISRLEKPTKGTILFNKKDIFHLKGRGLRHYRKNVQVIFQNPSRSLNPGKTVYSIISRGIRNFRLAKEKNIKDIVSEILKQAGLPDNCLYCYPHEFSAHQQLRISIARAIAVNPAFIICDEPVITLDVPVQTQVIHLLLMLKKKFGFSMLFISQDLSIVKHIADRILVMYRGQIVEAASSESLFKNTAHPYTKALISAIPEPGPYAYKGKIILKGEALAASGNIRGCCFAGRCYMAQDICRKEPPLGRQLIQGHTSYCHFAEKV